MSVANAAITNAVLEHIEHRKRVANAPVANVANADVANSDERVLRPRRGDREKYNARQREYMRKRRAK